MRACLGFEGRGMRRAARTTFWGVAAAVAVLVWVPAAGAGDVKVYERKASALAAKHVAARVQLALWCADQQLHDEAIGQLGLTRIIDPNSKAAQAAWLKLEERMPHREALVKVSTRDGNLVTGVGGFRPFVVQSHGATRLVPVSRLRGVQLADEKPGGTVFTLETSTGEKITGSVLTPTRFGIVTKLGTFSVPVADLRSLTIESLSVKTDTAGQLPPDPERRMQACFETLSVSDNAYALLGAAQYHHALYVRGSKAASVAAIRDSAKQAIRADTATGDALIRTGPVTMDRIVLNDGTEVVGEIRAKSGTMVMISETTPTGSRVRRIRTADIRSSGRATVSADTFNRSVCKELCRSFASAAKTGNHMTVLTVYGKLMHAFPNGKWSDELTRMLGSAAGPVSIAKSLEDAALWAATTCPQCRGGKTLVCELCKGKGKIETQKVCPDCGGAKPTKCERCGGKGWLRCNSCNGTGRKRTPGVGHLRGGTEPCNKCAGRGRVRCRSCTRGYSMCKRCKNRGLITVTEPCKACNGKGHVDCFRCRGSGKWSPALAGRPGKRKTLTLIEKVFQSRRTALDEAQTDERVNLADWCVENGFATQAAQQLQLAGRIDPDSMVLMPAWTELVHKSKWETVKIVVTLADGNVIAGACALKPILVRHANGVELVSLRRLKGFRLVERTKTRTVVEVETPEGTVRGVLTSFPIALKNKLGKFSFTLAGIRNYTIEGSSGKPKHVVKAGGPDNGAKPTPEAGATTVDLDWSNHLAALRADGLDIVFVFDATGSMGGVILQVKTRIKELMNLVTRLVPDARLGLVAYRDREQYDMDDYEYAVKFQPLMEGDARGLDTLEMFLRRIEAYGGGDIPEAVRLGVTTAMSKAGWREKSKKIIIVFGDAPPRNENRGRAKLYGEIRAWREKTKGVLSCIDTSRKSQPMEEFTEMAKAGGGDSVTIADEKAIIKQLTIFIFGSKWKDQVEKAMQAPPAP